MKTQETQIDRLFKVLGQTTAKLLLDNFSGELIYIPSAAKEIYDNSKQDMEIIKYITEDDLTDDMKMIAQTMGLGCTIGLMSKYGGIKIHIMKLRTCRMAVLKAIKNKLKEGNSINQIVSELNIPKSKVIKIIGYQK